MSIDKFLKLEANLIHGQYWTASINPIKAMNSNGKLQFYCDPCSPGCLHCWASDSNKRCGGDAYGSQKQPNFCLDEKVLEKLAFGKDIWRRPQINFVCHLTDIFHPAVHSIIQEQIFDVLIASDRHIHLVLTKRVKRMADFLTVYLAAKGLSRLPDHIFCGGTICNQVEANVNVQELLRIPGNLWLSIEPYLEWLDLVAAGALGCNCPPVEDENGEQEDRCSGKCRFYLSTKDKSKAIDWIVVGSESGHHRRPAKLEWIKSIVDQCKAAGVPCFVKQVEISKAIKSSKRLCGPGYKTPRYKRYLSKDPTEWPEEFRVRELPW